MKEEKKNDNYFQILNQQKLNQKTKVKNNKNQKTKQKQMFIKKNRLMGMAIGILRIYQDQMLFLNPIFQKEQLNQRDPKDIDLLN